MTLNIAILSPEFIPVKGGTGAYVEGLARNFPREVNLHIVTPLASKKCDRNFLSLEDNITVHHLGTTSYSFTDNLSFQRNVGKKLSRIVTDYGIDLVHSQSALPDRFIDPEKLGIPIVTTIHSTIEDQIANIRTMNHRFTRLSRPERYCILLSPILKRIENNYYSSARYFIAVSEWTKQQVLQSKHINPSRITVIHNGVDSEKFIIRGKKEVSTFFPGFHGPDVIRILFMSRMNASKGLYTYLDAISDIRFDNNLHFIFAGPGRFPKIHLPKGSYTYLGPVDHDIAHYLYNLVDIFVLPSLYENFPISVLEAMASELAVIASKVGGIPEMIHDGTNGVLLTPGNPAAIRESILMLANDETLRKSLGNEARQSIEREFNWKKTAANTLNYYRKILGQ